MKPDELRRVYPVEGLPFEATDRLTPLDEVVAQAPAVQAIAFGVGIRGAGFNLFVHGSPGTGKSAAIKRFLALEASMYPAPPDWCYMNNFADPQRPRSARCHRRVPAW